MAQLLTLLRELVIAGNETSGKLITEIVRLLDTTPDEWDRVRADPDAREADRGGGAAVGDAVADGVPPRDPRHPTRRCRDPRRLGAGGLLRLGQSRRGPSSPTRPGSTPIATDSASTWPSGSGMHACIGNPLARMEAVIATQVLADHVESLTVLAPESLRYNASFMVRGLQQLPVRVRRRATD